MAGRLSLQDWLEIINGAWGTAALCLFMVALAYFGHEWIIRNVSIWRWRADITLGMRVALAMMTISLGVMITRLLIYAWRMMGASDFERWQLITLLIGAAVGYVGFICAIREYSKTLYGSWVWITSLLASLAVAGFTALQHFP